MEASLGYRFVNGLKLDFGWRRVEETGIVIDTLGLLLSFDFTI